MKDNNEQIRKATINHCTKITITTVVSLKLCGLPSIKAATMTGTKFNKAHARAIEPSRKTDDCIKVNQLITSARMPIISDTITWTTKHPAVLLIYLNSGTAQHPGSS